MIENTSRNIRNKFLILSFNYRHFPLEEREKFIRKGYKSIIEKYRDTDRISGYVALETCLRVELYLEITKKFEIEELKREFRSENVQIYSGDRAVEYILRVICGLESIIKGEDQILAQLRKAYFLHLENGKTSALLNIIFNNAIETGKKFRSESRINEKNISLDSIAVKFIKTKFDSLENKKIFIIGVGDLSQSILALLYKIENCELTMTNRSMHKSIEILKLFDGIKLAEFNQKYDIVKESDIIISATSAPHLVLTEDRMKEILNDGRKRFFLDLAVPRDIDEKISGYENTALYHLEDIWETYNENIGKREELVKQYFYIIEEQADKIYKKIEKRSRYSCISAE